MTSEDRVIRLETVVESQAQSIGVLGDDIKGLAEDVHYFAESMNQHMASAGRTNWSTLASWAAVIISVIVLAGSGFIRDLGRLESSFNTVIWEETIPYLRDGQVPKLQVKIEMLQEQVEALKERDRMLLERIKEDGQHLIDMARRDADSIKSQFMGEITEIRRDERLLPARPHTHSGGEDKQVLATPGRQ